MATSNCTITGQTYNTNAYSLTAYHYAGFNYNNAYYVYRLKFTTPEFQGVPTSLTFNIVWDRPKVNNSTASAFSLRWALLTSDDQFALYRNTKNEVTDDTDRLAVGIVAWDGMTKNEMTKTLVVETSELQPNTEYWLYLWGDGSSGKQQNYSTACPATRHEVILEYIDTYTVSVEHKTQDEDGTLSLFHSESHTISIGEYFTPTTVEAPTDYKSEDATYKAWDTGWGLIATGLANIDAFPVNQDMYVTIYYQPDGSFIYVNINDQEVKCEVYVNRYGEAVRCDAYVNIYGEAVKI